MKRNVVTVLAFAGTLCFSAVAEAANIVVGSGADYSYFVFESSLTGVVTYEVHYTFSPTTPLDSWALLQIIDSEDDGFSLTAMNYGDESTPNWFISSITLNGVTQANTGGPTYAPYWTYSVAGGESGSPMAAVEEGSWSEGYGASFRYVSQGSWDGFYYGSYGDTPSVAPVPEPSAALVALTGGLFFLRRRRVA